jgi:LysM repeat protein
VARTQASPKRRHPTWIIVGVLVLVAVIAVVGLVGLGGGGDDEPTKASASKPKPKSSTTSAPRTTTTTVRGPVQYTIQQGDIITPLAAVFGVSTAAILKANPDVDPNNLVVGSVLTIPSPIPLSLKISPHKTVVGGSISIKLKGAREAETVTFEIQRPTTPFVGQPHTATTDGEVSATYELGLADPPGTYTVVARGDQGTVTQTTFIVEK